MELSTAISLIENAIVKSSEPQRWADLGAGDGFFTRALASLIPNGSTVVAVDKNSSSLKSIQDSFRQVKIAAYHGDFTSLTWGENFSGVLMANALHYVRAQTDFLTKLKVKLSDSGRILVVEYERTQANPWVPYPITLGKLQEIGAAAGFSSVAKLGETSSMYDHAMIYSACLIQ
jgi:ubiquinone/menaquinone biosynthesis C-methylase UbiE